MLAITKTPKETRLALRTLLPVLDIDEEWVDLLQPADKWRFRYYSDPYSEPDPDMTRRKMLRYRQGDPPGPDADTPAPESRGHDEADRR